MSKGRLPESAEKRTVIKLTGKQGQKEPTCFVRQEKSPFVGQASDVMLLETPYCTGFLFDRVAGLLASEGICEPIYTACLTVSEQTEEKQLRNLVHGIVQAATERGLPVPALQVMRTGAETPELFLSGAGMPEFDSGEEADQSGTPGEPADKEIVMAGHAGKEATAYLMHVFRNRLQTRLASQYLDMGLSRLCCSDMRQAIAVARANRALVKLAGEGGVFTALWQLGDYLDCGMEISLRSILLFQETIEVCEILDVNPYLMRSTGCFFAVTEHAETLLGQYSELGIPAVKVGKCTKMNRDRIVLNEDEKRFLEPFREDEWFRISREIKK